MLARMETHTVVGLSAVSVMVEVDVTDGLPGVTIVGLPDPTVRESKERIKSAIRNTQYQWPMERITVNLAPADVRKEGSIFDLPIALGLLSASGQLEGELFADCAALGELALDGTLRPVPGALPIALSLQGKGKRLLLPAANAPEAAVVEGVRVIPIRHLAQAISYLKGEEQLPPFQVDLEKLFEVEPLEGVDFSEVKGQTIPKRAIEVAVAGGHNLLMMGPPGAGKTMLAKRIPTIMPLMTLAEALETTQVYSVLGLTSPDRPLVTVRPFRAPHQTISDAALLGGGSIPQPGEISLAHHGVLFLDELPEFNRLILESLRQPLEEGRMTVSRVQGKANFPARVMLIAAMNPCPCGFAGDPRKTCLCPPSQILRYRRRISGPLLDRIDLQLEVSGLGAAELMAEGAASGEPSAKIRRRIERARQRQRVRFEEEPGIFTNAQMRHRHLKRCCRINPEVRELLKKAIEKLGLSARGFDKVLKVSRTIADLADSEEIQPEHLAEAIQYRALDRSTWT